MKPALDGRKPAGFETPETPGHGQLHGVRGQSGGVDPLSTAQPQPELRGVGANSAVDAPALPAHNGWHSQLLKRLRFWLLHHVISLWLSGGVGILGEPRHGPSLVHHLICLGHIGGNLRFPLRGSLLVVSRATTSQNQSAGRE